MPMFTGCFYAPEIEDLRGGILFLSCLSFCPPLWNFNLANNFWKVSARALVFHMSIPCDKTFPWVPLFFTLWPWPWSLTHFLKTLTYLIIWTASATAFILHMSISCDKIFLLVSRYLSLWPSLAIFGNCHYQGHCYTNTSCLLIKIE